MYVARTLFGELDEVAQALPRGREHTEFVIAEVAGVAVAMGNAAAGRVRVAQKRLIRPCMRFDC